MAPGINIGFENPCFSTPSLGTPNLWLQTAGYALLASKHLAYAFPHPPPVRIITGFSNA